MTRLAVVSAGLGQPSSTGLLADRLARATAQALRDDAEITTIDLRDHAHAVMDHLLTGFPGASLRPALEAVERADGLIAVTPVFNASYSGLFKSFFDVLDRDSLDGTPVLPAATGGTARHSMVIDHALRPMFAHLRATLTPTAVFAATEDWGNDRALPARITRAGGELASLIEARPALATRDPYEDPIPFARLLSNDPA
ncbi:FMN reductase [Spirillospora sp. CA-294931]|uniref:FMN reductase n=1 Tax=Spirillospora sp. CA-294931 TaxID=3240042 RepID=UPI003D929B25